MAITLQGLVDRNLNVLCIRGFAKIRDLANVSEAKAYQRKLDDTHKNEITHYLQTGGHKFFPEVILSYEINSAKDNIQLAQNEHGYEIDKSKKASIKFTPKNTWQMLTITIKEEDLKVFNRVDGNHRLAAIEGIGDNSTIDDQKIPFCIILLDRENDQNDKYQSIIFHTINAKVKPLTSEENLKAICENNRLSDDELREQGIEYLQTRLLHAELDKDYLTDLYPVLENKSYSALYSAIELLSNPLAEDSTPVITTATKINAIKKKLVTLNKLYEAEPLLKTPQDSGLFTVFLYFAFTAPALLEPLKDWVVRNQLYNIKNVDAESVIKIFKKIHDNRIKIFMAMPFYNVGKVNFYNRELKQAIQELSQDMPHVNLEAFEIMQNKGDDLDLIADIMQKIQECSIFIADISEKNPNVAYEYGTAKALNKTCILFKQESDTSLPMSDIRNNQYITITDHNLKDKFKEHIKCVLEKHFNF